MKRSSTLFLRGAVLLITLVVLALCVFALPAGLRSEHAGPYRPILWGLYITAIPFFIGAYQTWKLLGNIDQNQAFSRTSVTALGNIKYCAAIISVLYAAGLPYLYMVANQDDAPGVLLLGLVLTVTSGVIATFAAVLQKLLQEAIHIKSENDLTV
jgi:membrane protease YdiL (CAAX protease family)